MVTAPFAEMKIIYDLKILQKYIRKAYKVRHFLNDRFNAALQAKE